MQYKSPGSLQDVFGSLKEWAANINDARPDIGPRYAKNAPRMDWHSDFTGIDLQAIGLEMANYAWSPQGIYVAPGARNLRGSEIIPLCQDACRKHAYGPDHLLPDIKELLTKTGQKVLELQILFHDCIFDVLYVICYFGPGCCILPFV